MKMEGYQVITAKITSPIVGITSRHGKRRARGTTASLTDIEGSFVAGAHGVVREDEAHERHDHPCRCGETELAVLEGGAVDVPAGRFGCRARTAAGEDELRLDLLDAAQHQD